MTTNLDEQYMLQAIQLAKQALDTDNYPVAAILTIDDEFIGEVHNSLHEKNNWASHAEAELLRLYSSQIKAAYKNGKKITLYSTLEPCLMCLGTAVLHRVHRILYACPDPHGGATKVDHKNLPEWYERKWPDIRKGLYRQESYDLLIAFMDKKNTATWQKIKLLFEEMKSNW